MSVENQKLEEWERKKSLPSWVGWLGLGLAIIIILILNSIAD